MTWYTSDMTWHDTTHIFLYVLLRKIHCTVKRTLITLAHNTQTPYQPPTNTLLTTYRPPSNTSLDPLFHPSHSPIPVITRPTATTTTTTPTTATTTTITNATPPTVRWGWGECHGGGIPGDDQATTKIKNLWYDEPRNESRNEPRNESRNEPRGESRGGKWCARSSRGESSADLSAWTTRVIYYGFR